MVTKSTVTFFTLLESFTLRPIKQLRFRSASPRHISVENVPFQVSTYFLK
jgi:hypothetical protein